MSISVHYPHLLTITFSAASSSPPTHPHIPSLNSSPQLLTAALQVTLTLTLTLALTLASSPLLCRSP